MWVVVELTMVCDRESEDINALIQARFTSFSTENVDYPDFSSMKIKGVRALYMYHSLASLSV